MSADPERVTVLTPAAAKSQRMQEIARRIVRLADDYTSALNATISCPFPPSRHVDIWRSSAVSTEMARAIAKLVADRARASGWDVDVTEDTRGEGYLRLSVAEPEPGRSRGPYR